MARILIVEDDRILADTLASALRLEGHEVLLAASADEGIRIGLARHPDVVVAEWMLAGERHGGTVCQWIHAACPSARSIIITPDAIPQAARWCASASAVLETPFHTEEILRAIDRVMSGTLPRRPLSVRRGQRTIRAMT